MEQDEGFITAVGEGMADVVLSFIPSTASFVVEGLTYDPTPGSQEPEPYDKVSCSIARTENGEGYKLVFTWTVFGVKSINWRVKSA